ncbi:uromodulin-like 1 [Branchiostoma lanceolatum]|uniref:uromodulin-like 1 n=1 Tax=Branchiostoma lanceolatum TaxID=7740 RepID=UPI003452AD68
MQTIYLYLSVGLSSNFLSVSDITFRSGSLYGGHTLETKKGSTTAPQVTSMLQAVLDTTTLFTNVTIQDYDECSNESRNDCFQHSECVNTPGSFTCSCPTGFIDRNLTRPGRICGTNFTTTSFPVTNMTINLTTTQVTTQRYVTTASTPIVTFSTTDLKVVKVSQSQYSEAYPATVDVSVTLQKTAGDISSDDINVEGLSAVLLFTNNGNLEDATVRSSTFAATISDYDLAFLKTFAGRRTSLTFTNLKASNVAVDNNCTSYTHLCLKMASTNANVQFGTNGDTCLQLGSGEGQAGPKNCMLIGLSSNFLSVSDVTFRSGSLYGGHTLETKKGSTTATQVNSMLQAVLGTSTLFKNVTVQDYDECSNESRNDCFQHSECVNTPGSFTCSCPTGFIDRNLTRPGRTCGNKENVSF